MAPGVGRKFPSFRPHGVSHRFCFGDFFFKIEIRVFLQELCLPSGQAGRLPRLIYLIRPVAQHAFISGQGNDSLVPVVGEIRMAFHKCIDQRDDVIIADAHAPVILDIAVLHFSVFIHDQLFRKSVPGHIVVIAAVVLTEDKGLLSCRKPDLLRRNRPVLRHFHHIVHADHDIAPVVHLLDDGIKLGDRGHNLIIAIHILVPVKRFRVIPDKGMEKYMGNLVNRVRGTAGFCLLIGGNQDLAPVAAVKSGLSFQQFDRGVIVVLGRQPVRLRLKALLLRAHPLLRLRLALRRFHQIPGLRRPGIVIYFKLCLIEKQRRKARQNQDQERNQALHDQRAASPADLPLCDRQILSAQSILLRERFLLMIQKYFIILCTPITAKFD